MQDLIAAERSVAVVVEALWALVAFALVARIERARFGTSAAPSPQALVGVALAIAATATLEDTAQALAGGCIAIALVAAAGADARHGLLFDGATSAMAAIGIANACRPEHTAEALAGALGFGGIFLAIHVASRGRAIGYGDVKALFAIGAVFGPFAALLGIIIASLSSIAAASASMRKGARPPLPFGPHLAIGALTAQIAGPAFVHDYLRL